MLIAIAVLLYAAVVINWKYALAIVPLMVAVVLICKLRMRMARARDLRALRRICKVMGSPVPTLQHASVYAWPTFTPCFETKADYEKAEALGSIDAFKEFIQARYAHLGDKKRPFEVERALRLEYLV